MKQTPTIAVIGAGNMGTSLIHGLIKSGHPADKIWGTSPNQTSLEQLQQHFQIHTTSDNEKACQEANVIIFAVKPPVFQQVATALSHTIQTHQPLVMSIVTGIRLGRIEEWLGKHTAIVRAMPNTPALIGAGTTALIANSAINKQQLNLAESIMRAVGSILWLKEEKLMDAVTAVSGSGPAYFFLVMEALQQAAQQLGLSQETASLLVKETALGAARMAIESNDTLEKLRQKVTSPGGTTEKAIAVMEENHLRKIFENAVNAAAKRSEELG